MFNHAPENYDCPFCRLVKGEDIKGDGTKQADIIYQTNHITAFINARWWQQSKAHVLIIPNVHIENIYDLTPDIAIHVHEAARLVAIALKHVYACEGISTRQHNEPAGYQEVFHYHLHVFPRYMGDRLYEDHHTYYWSKPDERIVYANQLKAYFANLKP